MLVFMNKRANILAWAILCLALASCSSSKFEAQATAKLMHELSREEAYIVMGMVHKPGKYAVDKSKSLKVSEAILRAQGFSNFADKKYVVLRRGCGEYMQRIYVDLSANSPSQPKRLDRDFGAGEVRPSGPYIPHFGHGNRVFRSGEKRFDPVIRSGDVIIAEEIVFSF